MSHNLMHDTQRVGHHRSVFDIKIEVGSYEIPGGGRTADIFGAWGGSGC